MGAIIKVENLIFSYSQGEGLEEERALNQITLEIEEGSFTAIIGKNGSGKSTLAKCMNALLLPVEGTVVVGGYDTKDEDHIWDVRQTAGMVFQNPDNQIVSAIVEDDVAFGPENLGIEADEIRKRVDAALQAVDMEEFRKKAPHLLSGGQKQRIAIAGAIAMKPKCIIFDEPTAMLDPKGRKEVMKLIEDLNRENITCILITHFMEEAAHADRVIIMEDGEVRLDGKPEDVFAKREELRTMNLDVPMAVELSHRLRARGMDIPPEVINEKELIDALCQLK